LIPWLTASGELWVVTPDSRGHGRSTNPDGALSYARLADDMAALIEVLGLDRPSAITLSDMADQGSGGSRRERDRETDGGNARNGADALQLADGGWQCRFGVRDANGPSGVLDCVCRQSSRVGTYCHPGSCPQLEATPIGVVVGQRLPIADPGAPASLMKIARSRSLNAQLAIAS
jgi:hypothetical protein